MDATSDFDYPSQLGPKQVQVRIPDMFSSFMSKPARVNPHYEQVKVESEAWINEVCGYTGRMAKRIVVADFSYFCAIVAPDATLEELRTICDWGNWVFPFDDMFDSGAFRSDPHGAAQLMASLESAMQHAPSPIPKIPLVNVHDSVWARLSAKCSEGTQRRFAEGMRIYCRGALQQVVDQAERKVNSVEEMIEVRRESAGVSPLFALFEYANDLDIPDEVMAHPAIKEIERVGTDLVMLQNDVCSYCKEEAEGVFHNVVAMCRRAGLSAQQALDHIGTLLAARYRDWYLALASLPAFGEELDRQVHAYIQGVQNVVYANLNWSFKSKRYFGAANNEVRISRVISVLAELPPVEESERSAEDAVPRQWCAEDVVVEVNLGGPAYQQEICA